MKKITLFALLLLLSTSLIFPDQLQLRNNRSVLDFPQISGTGNRTSSLKTFSDDNISPIREIETIEGSVIEVEDSEYFINPTLPIIPQTNLQFSIPGRIQVSEINLINGNAAESRTQGQIISHFQRVEWSLDSEHNVIKRTPNQAVYQKDQFFPGNWLSYTAGFDGENTKVYIQLYPLQWNPISQEVIYLTDYTLSINGMPILSPALPASGARTDAVHLVISPTDWLNSATDLAAFHTAQGISSDVVDLADIAVNYTPAEDPTATGYANMTNPVNANYDYELAKKLISYLRDDAEHPNLELITLLGSGEWLPPSYYFYNPYGGDYSDWIPSDHYYASPDYDWVDNFSVCRIPVHSTSDLDTYISKLQDVVSHLAENWVENVTLSGGNAFEDDFYTGEMINNMAICEDLCDEMNIEKYQRYQNRFSSNAFIQHAQNDDYLLHLHICHGSGDAVYFDEGPSVSGIDLLSFPAKERLPIFLTVACMNGAFDTELHNGGYDLSFSEGMIASPGAGIVYVGGSRSNGGVPSHYIDEGNLHIIGIDDTALLLLDFMQAYRDLTDPTIGDLAAEAKASYLAVCNMNYEWVKAAYVRFVCHGSSALQLPTAPAQNPQTTIPTICSASSVGVNEDDYQLSEIQFDEPLIFNISDADVHDLQSVEISADGTISTQDNIQNFFELDVPYGESIFLNKVINAEEKEAWHYSVNYRFRLKHVDGDLEDWNMDEIIASDAMGDITPGIFDLSIVYAAFDDTVDEIYLAFPEDFSDLMNADIYKIYYAFAIDDQTGGISDNFADLGLFPVNSYLGFADAGIDKIILVSLTSMNGEINTECGFYNYDVQNGIWQLQPLTESAVTDGGVELRFPAGFFDYQNCQVSLVSSAWELLPTQQHSIIVDAVPSDPACLPDLTFGVENAITISEYFDFSNWVDAEEEIISNPQPNLSAYPNPFNPTTEIAFSLNSSENVNLNIFNLKGQKVKQLVNEQRSAGNHSVTWHGIDDNGKAVSSGVYFVRLKSGNEQHSTKILLLK